MALGVPRARAAARARRALGRARAPRDCTATPPSPDGATRTRLARCSSPLGASVALAGLGGARAVGRGLRWSSPAAAPPSHALRRLLPPARCSRAPACPPPSPRWPSSTSRSSAPRRSCRSRSSTSAAPRVMLNGLDAHRRRAHVDGRRVDAGAAREDARRAARVIVVGLVILGLGIAGTSRLLVVATVPPWTRRRRVGRRRPRHGARVHHLLGGDPRVGARGSGRRGVGVAAARAGARRGARDRHRRRDRGGAVCGGAAGAGIAVVDALMLVTIVMAIASARGVSGATTRP